MTRYFFFVLVFVVHKPVVTVAYIGKRMPVWQINAQSSIEQRIRICAC